MGGQQDVSPGVVAKEKNMNYHYIYFSILPFLIIVVYIIKKITVSM